MYVCICRYMYDVCNVVVCVCGCSCYCIYLTYSIYRIYIPIPIYIPIYTNTNCSYRMLWEMAMRAKY